MTTPTRNQHTKSPIRYLWLAIGFLSFALGTLGIVLPLLPTVPFYLFAAFCFAKGSQKIHDRFVATKLYKKYLLPFANKNGMTLAQKFRIMATTAIIMGITYMVTDMPYTHIILTLAWTIQFFVLFFFVKTYSKP